MGLQGGNLKDFPDGGKPLYTVRPNTGIQRGGVVW